MTRLLSKDIAVLNDGTMWRIPTDNDIPWRLTHAQDSITETDMLILASLWESYNYMIFECTQKRRNAVCEEIKELMK